MQQRPRGSWHLHFSSFQVAAGFFFYLFPFHGTSLVPSVARLQMNGRIHPPTLLSPQSQNKAKQCKESATEAGTRPWPLVYPQLVLSRVQSYSSLCMRPW